MKNFFLIFVMILFSQSVILAKDVTFIYINGSNNNTPKMTNWFLNGVKKLHPELKKQFEVNENAKKWFLDEGEDTISKNPEVFFWGDRSKYDLEIVKENLSLSRGVSPFLAYKVRSMIAECFHDAIWVQKPHNMKPILEDLDIVVKNEVAKGNEVLLLGYSAGSFITTEYLFTKIPYLNLKRLFQNINSTPERISFIEKNPRKNSCFAAISTSQIATFSDEDNLIANPSEELFKKNYLNIDSYTDTYCAPGDSIKGVVNFASPLVLFYSELGDPHYQPTSFLKYLYRYLVEHDICLLTVNYCDDPLGYPTTKNLTNKEIAHLLGEKFHPQLGFSYDFSDRISLRTTFGAHTSYWSTKKRFAKMIVDAYVEGYQYQYDKNIQEQVIKRQRKK